MFTWLVEARTGICLLQATRQEESRRRNTRNLSMLSFCKHIQLQIWIHVNTNANTCKYECKCKCTCSGVPKKCENRKADHKHIFLIPSLSYRRWKLFLCIWNIPSLLSKTRLSHLQEPPAEASWRLPAGPWSLPPRPPPPPPLPPCCYPPLLTLSGKLQGSWFCPCAHPGGGNIKRRKYENRDIWKELREKQHHRHFTNRKMKHRCHL